MVDIPLEYIGSEYPAERERARRAGRPAPGNQTYRDIAACLAKEIVARYPERVGTGDTPDFGQIRTLFAYRSNTDAFLNEATEREIDAQASADRADGPPVAFGSPHSDSCPRRECEAHMGALRVRWEGESSPFSVVSTIAQAIGCTAAWVITILEGNTPFMIDPHRWLVANSRSTQLSILVCDVR